MSSEAAAGLWFGANSAPGTTGLRHHALRLWTGENAVMASSLRELQLISASGEAVQLGQFLQGATLVLLPRYYG